MPVGPVDENRIAEGDVQAILDNGRSHENVGFVMHEFEHPLLQLCFRHLPVSDGYARSRYPLLELGSDFPDTLHSVMNEVRSEEHTSELQSLTNLVCRLLLEKKKKKQKIIIY